MFYGPETVWLISTNFGKRLDWFCLRPHRRTTLHHDKFRCLEGVSECSYSYGNRGARAFWSTSGSIRKYINALFGTLWGRERSTKYQFHIDPIRWLRCFWSIEASRASLRAYFCDVFVLLFNLNHLFRPLEVIISPVDRQVLTYLFWLWSVLLLSLHGFLQHFYIWFGNPTVQTSVI